LKIGILSGAIPSTTFIEALLRVLAKNGHEVLAFGTKQGAISSTETGVRYFCFARGRVSITLVACGYWLLFLTLRRKQAGAIFKRVTSERRDLRYFLMRSSRILPLLWFSPDVVHVQWAKSLPDWIVLHDFGVKLAVSLRGAHINYSPITEVWLAKAYKKCFHLVDGFHAVSEAIATEAEKYGADRSKTRVIYSYVRDEVIELGRFRIQRQYDWEGRAMRIISVGRYHWKKGYNYALDAMKILHDRGHDFRYSIVASGDNEEYLHQIYDLGITGKVMLQSGVSHKEALQEIYQSDVLLLPSVEEGVANVVLEAMALGTLVVTTASGGMEEIIQNGDNGILTNIRDPESLASALISVMRLSPSERKCIATRAYQSILERHTEVKFARSVGDFYKFVTV